MKIGFQDISVQIHTTSMNQKMIIKSIFRLRLTETFLNKV